MYINEGKEKKDNNSCINYQKSPHNDIICRKSVHAAEKPESLDYYPSYKCYTGSPSNYISSLKITPKLVSNGSGFSSFKCSFLHLEDLSAHEINQTN
jgi:hypothetical protein